AMTVLKLTKEGKDEEGGVNEAPKSPTTTTHTPVNNPTTPVNNPTTPVNSLTTPVNNPTTSVNNSTTPVNNPTTPVNNLTTPVNNLTTPVNNPTTPVNNLTTPVNNLTTPVNNLTTPVNNPTTPVNNPTTPVNNPTTPVNNPTTRSENEGSSYILPRSLQRSLQRSSQRSLQTESGRSSQRSLPRSSQRSLQRSSQRSLQTESGRSSQRRRQQQQQQRVSGGKESIIMESLSEGEFCSVNHELRTLTPDEEKVLLRQDSRGLVAGFHQHKLEKEAAKNWDKFYKRNENRFFKDRHWTTREFHELIGSGNSTRTLLEVGCGVGNFVYPLIEDGLNLFIYACDFSPRAVQLVKSDARYDESKIRAFECDITKDDLQSKMDGGVDIINTE
ncbi:hypothetical protein Pcinc_034147, partial [Petrolisthes cinctipes]